MNKLILILISLVLILSNSYSLHASQDSLFASSNNEFAFKFYQKIDKLDNSEDSKNFVYSPLGVSSVFNMAAYGAQGATRTQILEALCMPYSFIWNSSSDHFGTDYGAYLKSLESSAGSLSLANALVLTGGVGGQKPNLQYAKFIRSVFDSDILKGNLEDINSWVSNKTHGKIPKILSQLNPNSVCVLINAVYFKANWKVRFDTARTKDVPFFVSKNNPVSVPTMNQKAKYPFVDEKDYVAISLPYADSKYSMLIVCPKQESLDEFSEKVGLSSLAGGSSQTPKVSIKLESILRRLAAMDKNTEVVLSMPKFKIESSLDLVPVFESMGVIDAFSDSRADFSKAFDNVFISAAKHKAYIAVDEVGTEAAAATAIEMSEKSVSINKPQPKEIKINSPFFFFVLDNKSDSVIMMGRVTNPVL